MKINANQLDTHLSKSIASIYLIHGDETLLVDEAKQKIRRYASKKGFDDIKTFTITPQFNWQQLWENSANFSLFSQSSIIELSMPTGKPGEKGAKELIAYCAKPIPDNLIVIISSKLDSTTQRSVWYKALEKHGVVIPIWPIE